MKYVKMLGLAALAAAALMAFVGASSASATVLCLTEGVKNGGVTGTTCPEGWALSTSTEVHAVNEGTGVLTTTFKNIECKKSTITATLEEEENAKHRAPLTLTEKSKGLTFEECNCEVVVLNSGTLEVEWIEGTHDGIIYSKNAEVTAECSTVFGKVHCIYSTGAGTELGKATSTATTGKTPTIDITEAVIPRLATNSLCAEQAKWDAKYEITDPDALWVTGET
jgi:hypothetical protein